MREEILRDWKAFDLQARLADIRIEALENAMKTCDPFSPNFERLALKWKELDIKGDDMFIEGLNYRQNYFRIGDELSRRRNERIKPYISR